MSTVISSFGLRHCFDICLSTFGLSRWAEGQRRYGKKHRFREFSGALRQETGRRGRIFGINGTTGYSARHKMANDCHTPQEYGLTGEGRQI
jgi:hypothetical protein